MHIVMEYDDDDDKKSTEELVEDLFSEQAEEWEIDCKSDQTV